MLSLILHLCWMCGWWSLTFVAIYKWRLLLYHLLCESFKYSFFFIKLFFLIWMLIQRHYIIENSPFDSRAQFSMSNQQYLYHHNKLLVFSAINSSHVLRMDFCMKNVWNDDFFCHSCSRNNSIDLITFASLFVLRSTSVLPFLCQSRFVFLFRLPIVSFVFEVTWLSMVQIAKL